MHREKTAKNCGRDSPVKSYENGGWSGNPSPSPPPHPHPSSTTTLSFTPLYPPLYSSPFPLPFTLCFTSLHPLYHPLHFFLHALPLFTYTLFPLPPCPPPCLNQQPLLFLDPTTIYEYQHGSIHPSSFSHSNLLLNPLLFRHPVI